MRALTSSNSMSLPFSMKIMSSNLSTAHTIGIHSSLRASIYSFAFTLSSFSRIERSASKNSLVIDSTLIFVNDFPISACTDQQDKRSDQVSMKLRAHSASLNSSWSNCNTRRIGSVKILKMFHFRHCN